METRCGAVAAGTQRLALTQEAVGSIPTPAITGSSSNRKTPVLQTGDSGAIPGGSTFHSNTIPWSSGDDAWFTSKKRWFKSIRGHLYRAQVRQRLSGSA